MNTGKKFEELFKLSVLEQGYSYTRLKDAGFVGDKSSQRRFTPKNICDCIVFGCGQIYFLELKSRKQSLRFDEVTQLDALEKKEIELQASEKTEGASAGVLVHFQNSDRIFYYNAMMTQELESIANKKSFNVGDIESLSKEHPAFCFELPKFRPAGKRKERIDVNYLF